jgi:hypothetical protein
MEVSNPGESFRKTVTFGLAHSEVGPTVCREFVSLVKNNEIIGNDGRFFETRKTSRAGQSIQADNNPVAVVSDKGIFQPNIGTAYDPEWKIEKRAKLSAPVSNKTRRGDD